MKIRPISRMPRLMARLRDVTDFDYQPKCSIPVFHAQKRVSIENDLCKINLMNGNYDNIPKIGINIDSNVSSDLGCYSSVPTPREGFSFRKDSDFIRNKEKVSHSNGTPTRIQTFRQDFDEKVSDVSHQCLTEDKNVKENSNKRVTSSARVYPIQPPLKAANQLKTESEFYYPDGHISSR